MQNSIFPLTSIMAADNSGSAFLEQNLRMRTSWQCPFNPLTPKPSIYILLCSGIILAAVIISWGKSGNMDGYATGGAGVERVNLTVRYE